MKTGGLAYTLKLKLNTKVMLTSNIDVTDKLNNGQMGRVYSFKFDLNGNIVKIYLKMDDETAGLRAMNSDTYAYQNKVVPVERVEKEIKLRKRRKSALSIKRLQFPLMLSWACTVHKVQGDEFEKGVVNCELRRQRCFNNGQFYVAVGRVMSLPGLFLTGKYDRNLIKVDQRATEQYDYMRKNCQLPPIEDFGSLQEDTLTITLLNTRSLPKHSLDIAADVILMECDIMCLTETQLTPESDNDCCLDIQPFITLLNSNEDRFLSLSYSFRHETVDFCFSEDRPGGSWFQIEKPSFSPYYINFVLIYRKNNNSQSDCISLLNELMMQDDIIHIILGDFNVNAFSENNYIDEFLSDYELVVNEPTHISGSLIDHVYVWKEILDVVDVSVFVKNVYFSDHDAIKIKLKLL